jgi:hypothetical protein
VRVRRIGAVCCVTEIIVNRTLGLDVYPDPFYWQLCCVVINNYRYWTRHNVVWPNTNVNLNTLYYCSVMGLYSLAASWVSILYIVYEYIYIYTVYIYITAVGLTAVGSSTSHIYTETVHIIQRKENKTEKEKLVSVCLAPSLRMIPWNLLFN